MAGSTRFDIRYEAVLRPLFGLLGAGHVVSGVTVAPTEVRIAMGWAFRARIPSIASRVSSAIASHLSTAGACMGGPGGGR